MSSAIHQSTVNSSLMKGRGKRRLAWVRLSVRVRAKAKVMVRVRFVP
jgi:hypothetical protein